MAKRGKGSTEGNRPKTGAPTKEHSLVLRTAESLGRMIAALQRELAAVRSKAAGASVAESTVKKRAAATRKPTRSAPAKRKKKRASETR